MLAFIKAVFVFFISFFQIIYPISPELAGGSDKYFYSFSPDMEYNESYATELEKNPDKDFVILCLTDVQMYDLEATGDMGDKTDKTIDKLVNETKPDLITITGDNAWGTVAYTKLIKTIDSYGIPWAAVMGNHDGQRIVSEFWAAYRFAEAKNCLFDYGPEDMGYGNYIINITENGNIIHTVFMMDTHTGNTYTLEDGSTISGYDHLWQNQIEWYKWAVNGIAAKAGHTVESSVFMHIPVYEYKLAWEAADYNAETGTYQNPDYTGSFGSNGEDVCCAPVNNGFFAACKELGSTKNMIAGHDHINDSSILYNGIRLTYCLKCGEGGYWTPEKSGGTMLTIDSDGHMATEHIYIDQALL